MNKFLLLCFTLCALNLFGQAIDSTDTEGVKIDIIKEVEITDAKDLYFDLFNNPILVKKDNEVVKYLIEQDSTISFSADKSFDIDYVDANNPLKLLLYNKSLNTVRTLDRNLTQTSEFNLFNLQDYDVSAVCLSSDDNLWIYDQNQHQLVKIDKQGKALYTSIALQSILPYTLSPSFIFEQNNRVYVYDDTNGIHIFDSFGELDTNVGITQVTHFQSIGNSLFYVQNNLIFQYDLRTGDLNILMPLTGSLANPYKKIVLAKGYIGVLYDDKVRIYTVK